MCAIFPWLRLMRNKCLPFSTEFNHVVERLTTRKSGYYFPALHTSPRRAATFSLLLWYHFTQNAIIADIENLSIGTSHPKFAMRNYGAYFVSRTTSKSLLSPFCISFCSLTYQMTFQTILVGRHEFLSISYPLPSWPRNKRTCSSQVQNIVLKVAWHQSIIQHRDRLSCQAWGARSSPPSLHKHLLQAPTYGGRQTPRLASPSSIRIPLPLSRASLQPHERAVSFSELHPMYSP